MAVGAQQRKPQIANGNFFSTSVGFVAGKSGEPARRDESACSNEDTGCDVASIPVLAGMCRWVGLGVIADNFIQMGCYLARQST